ncbi:GNAT family N-acetyltransferase [Vibrio sp. E150_011]
MEFIQAKLDEGESLAEIRAISMKPSLLELGRFDENRVRNRFLDNFEPSNTYKISLEGAVLGFYAVSYNDDCIYINHLYILPKHQGLRFGAEVINHIKSIAQGLSKPISLGALRGSRSNDFYTKQGFVKTQEDEFDIYYQFNGVS